MTRRITVVVGTDHHPFERIVRWADDRQRSHPDEVVTVQHGYTRAPSAASGIELMAPDELDQLLRSSDVVITHGGPGTIMGARNAGHHPLVLPRDPVHGEHVDGHQMHFARWAADKGLVQLVDTPERLDEVIGDLADGTRVAAEESVATESSAQRVARLVDEFDRGRLPVTPGATTVLYLAGADPSATAHVAELLQGSGPIPVLDENALLEARTCGCGHPVAECAFWGEVRRLVEAGGPADASPVPTPTGRFRRNVTVLLTGRKRLTGSLRRDVLRYAAARRGLYDAVRSVTEAPFVVDAGSWPAPLVALAHDRRIDLRVLHVVRDVRSVAAGGTDTPTWVARRWVAQNLAVDMVRRRGVPVERVRHEDLVATDGGALSGALAALGLPGPQDWSPGATESWAEHLGYVSDVPEVPTGTSRRLDAADVRRVTAIALPLLLKYGYPRSWM